MVASGGASSGGAASASLAHIAPARVLSCARKVALTADRKALAVLERAVDSQHVRDWGDDFASILCAEGGNNDIIGEGVASSSSLATAFADATTACLVQDAAADLYDAECALAAASMHLKIVRLPECSAKATDELLSPKVAEAAVTACKRCAHFSPDMTKEDEDIFSSLLHACYEKCVSGRRKLKVLIGSTIRDSMEDISQMRSAAPAVRTCLRIAASAFEGMIGLGIELKPHDVHFFRSCLLPLHRLPGKLSHMSPTLSLVHEPMVQCIDRILAVDETLASSCLAYLLDAWPGPKMGNTPKEVLLLNELETVLERIASAQDLDRDELLEKLLSQMDISLSSEHSTVCQRTLVLWNNETIQALLTHPLTISKVVPRIFGAILLRCSQHWNATVRKMSGAVLRVLRDAAPELAASAACRIWNSRNDNVATERLDKLVDELDPLIDDDDARDVDEKMDADESFPTDFAAGGTYVPVKHEGTSVMNIIQGRTLGRGTFGEVLYGLRVKPGVSKSSWPEVALKRMPAKHAEIAHREASVMDMVKHPNVTRLLAVYSSSRHVHLVLEYAALGDLHSQLAELGTLETKAARFVTAEVCAGLVAVHMAGLVFGDLKPENVLIHESGHAKLGDFGSARLCGHAQSSDAIEGTLHYLAPELLRGKPLTRGADWWAYGCLVYQCLAGRPPVVDAQEDKIMSRIVDFDVEDTSIFPDKFPRDAQAIVTRLLDPSPDRRLAASAAPDESIAEIQRCAFFGKHIDIETAYKMRAPTFTAGDVTPAGGKWTQRTFSMMVSPLMKSYSSRSILSPLSATDFEIGSPWFDASESRRKSRRAFAMPSINESKEGKKKEGSRNEEAKKPGRAAFRRAGGTPYSSKSVRPSRAAFDPTTKAVWAAGRPPPRIRSKRKGKGGVTPPKNAKYFFKGIDLTAG